MWKDVFGDVKPSDKVWNTPEAKCGDQLLQSATIKYYDCKII